MTKDLWQGNYLGKWIRDMTKNIRKDLKGTGDNGKENKLKKEKH